MENKKKIYISPNFARDDFLDLRLEQDSSEKDWEEAIRIFDDRLYGRFWTPIQILSNNINENGFAIMALDCLLIETLLQFSLGVEETPSAYWRSYSIFLNQTFPKHFNTTMARRFYSDIRCGILHSAQTKNNSRLTTQNEYVVSLENDMLSVSVERLTGILFDYYSEYKEKLRNRSNVELRRKFINKMNYICIR